MALPEPGSEELVALLGGRELHLRLYEVLYSRRDDPPTIHELRKILDVGSGQQHLDKRVRELRDHFVIETQRRGTAACYFLKDRLPESLTDGAAIKREDRAWALRHQRCSQCGRTPNKDGVRLHVDHKLPRSWGGTNDRENLQALCSECNEGKRDYFASIDPKSSKIAQASEYDEPHRRIGEALLAAYPDPLRSDVLEMIACSKQYQEDWQKRLRELRVLGWQISTLKKKEGSRMVSYYKLLEAAPEWPSGNIRAEISRIEKEKKKAKDSD